MAVDVRSPACTHCHVDGSDVDGSGLHGRQRAQSLSKSAINNGSREWGLAVGWQGKGVAGGMRQRHPGGLGNSCGGDNVVTTVMRNAITLSLFSEGHDIVKAVNIMSILAQDS